MMILVSTTNLSSPYNLFHSVIISSILQKVLGMVALLEGLMARKH